MKTHVILEVGLVLLLIMGTVSADTCSFINITQGPQGPNGTAATIAINATFTGAAGSDASVTNIGTTTAALFDIVVPQGIKGDTGAPDLTLFMFLNGSRSMTGNLSMGSQYINNVISGSQGSDLVNKTYVDTHASNYNSSYITSTFNSTYDAKSNYNASYLTSTYNSTYDAKSNYNSSYLSLDATGNLSLASKYINNLVSGGLATDAVNKSYVDTHGSSYNATYDAKSNYNASYWTGTNYNSSYLTSASTYNASYDAKVDTSNTTYVLTGGSRAMTGNLSLGSQYINSLFSGGLATDAVNKSYVDSHSGSYNASYWTGTNYNSTYDAKPSSTYNATYDGKLGNPLYGYVTLMAGSAMVTTTNPSTMTQTETSTNKNNYISMGFADGGSEVAQWVYDFPNDWNSSANVVFTPLWMAPSGSGGVNFTVKAKLFPNDAALDTALGVMGNSVDTITSAGDLEVAPDTTGAAISSVASGGNTVIIAVNRNSAAGDDTAAVTVQLIGLRMKYSTIKG